MEPNYISDKEIHNLLKKRLLEQDDEALMEAEARRVFSSPVAILPNAKLEKKFLKTIKQPKTVSFKWILYGSMTIIGVVAFLYLKPHREQNKVLPEPAEEQFMTTGTIQKNILTETTDENQEEPAQITKEETVVESMDPEDRFSINEKGSYVGLGVYTGQVLAAVHTRNADCTDPVFINDSVFVLAHTSRGYGYKKEISGNEPTDSMYLEEEINSAWYKFTIKKNCKLTMDIVSMYADDNYDFMLFQHNGFYPQSKIMDKTLKPIRTCISELNIKGKTGMALDEELPSFVHDHNATPYVKYVNAKKGEVYYLLVNTDNKSFERTTYGKGYTIRLHFNQED